MALFAVFCLSAVTASGAFAAVKKGELVSKSTGKALTKKGFTSSGATQTLETTGGGKVTCTAGTGTGEVTSTTTATQTVKFTGCVNASGLKCKSSGLKAGEIEIGKVAETLGWKLGSKKESLVLLSTVSGTFAFECGEVKNEAKGEFLAPVGAGNEGSANAKAKFSFTAAQTKGVQAETAYESLAGTEVKNQTLEAKLLKASEPFVQAAQEGTETVTLEEEAEFL
jgi:hypothetical protein